MVARLAAERTSLARRLAGFVSRVGGMVLQPRTTLAAVLAGGRGGLTDLLLLLLLLLLAVHLRPLVASAWFMGAVSYSGGLSALLNTVAQGVLHPVVGVFIGTLVASFTTRRRAGRERNTDLVALAALPAVCLDLALTFAAWATGWRPGPVVVLVATGLGTAWFVARAALAIGLVRGGAPAGEGSDG